MKRFWIGIFFCVVSWISVEAFKVNPMCVEMMQKNPQGFFQITNNTNSEEVILAYSAYRNIDEWGNESNEECEEFIIYPSHLVLQPGEQRLVRVIWKAKESLSSERAYRMVFEQQATRVPKTEQELEEGVSSTSIGIGFKYVCSLYVCPHEKAKPDIQVENFSVVEEDGKEHLLLEVENKGIKHKFLSAKTIEVNLKLKKEQEGDLSGWFSLPDEFLEGNADMNMNILAGSKRYVKIPITSEIPRNIVSVSVVD